jgi:hypothetical protein
LGERELKAALYNQAPFKHAKNGLVFDAMMRHDEIALLKHRFQREIDRSLVWAHTDASK